MRKKTEMKKLWLDDLRLPPEDCLWAKNYDEAIEILEKENISAISFDHDLGDVENGQDKEKSGYDVALYLAERAYNGLSVPSEVYIHSANPVGRERIAQTIKRYLGENTLKTGIISNKPKIEI